MAAASQRQKLPIWSRLALGSGLVVYAALAAGSAADRLSADNPGLAAKVPAPFGSVAVRTLGAQSLSDGKALDALALGTRAIRDAPTDPQSTALFGAGKLATGDRLQADRAFRIAGQLGWRVPITQSYWMGQALADGKYDIAALRLDALLRQQPALLRQRQLIDPMERNPAGQAAMIARMQLRPAWLKAYTGDVFGLPVDMVLQRAEVLSGAARAGLVVGCDQAAPIASMLAGSGQPKAGVALWQQHCPAAGTSLIGDERLLTLDIGATPSAFTWVLVGNGDLSLAIGPSGTGPGKRVQIDGRAERARPVLTQQVVLDPGRYALSWRTGDSAGRASDHVLAAVACPGEAPVWLTPTLDRATNLWRAQLQVDARCPAQQLIFAAAAHSGPVWLEQINLVRAP